MRKVISVSLSAIEFHKIIDGTKRHQQRRAPRHERMEEPSRQPVDEEDRDRAEERS